MTCGLSQRTQPIFKLFTKIFSETMIKVDNFTANVIWIIKMMINTATHTILKYINTIISKLTN
ncbi:hypothetical protein C5F63_03180 [Photobacterium damselae subsp. damselae]|nr:hypothetical protein BST98_20170 [Photobacterium damselae]PSB78481.1 hypothetical protein C5F62_17465 [Photobacterium damselae subsp. damselae]PSB80415.1 hypothetical protein C5F61_03730 [Photobacterium damselae subsp. damselae]PSB89875.1 hypothetical protein C5F63_03180 [Photobacterium damselae subsp. damselae]